VRKLIGSEDMVSRGACSGIGVMTALRIAQHVQMGLGSSQTPSSLRLGQKRKLKCIFCVAVAVQWGRFVAPSLSRCGVIRMLEWWPPKRRGGRERWRLVEEWFAVKAS